ncbi:hypothetical protein KOR42_02830 [Thalassoglobus neptunius]|uniref:Uncharacterized protein n=1 Tax=Thalassoglobus neptunius TaxID=1938619 RepID=A0A5C5X1N3_9PLAN|nr:hypothetical protein KOR42_02830 [Thalassoglobus neptunius]
MNEREFVGGKTVGELKPFEQNGELTKTVQRRKKSSHCRNKPQCSQHSLSMLAGLR